MQFALVFGGLQEKKRVERKEGKKNVRKKAVFADAVVE